MDTPRETLHVFHYPRLVVDGPPQAMLGGELTSFSFDEFERLDSIWARKSYFDKTRPAVWRARYNSSQPTLDPLESALLIYHALLVVTDADLPDPRLSVHYTAQDGAVRREIGPFERTFLINGMGTKTIGPDIMAKVAALAERWAQGGLRWSDSVFAPLRGLAVAASSAVPPPFDTIPMLVSLEGLLLPRQVDGIARQMAQCAEKLLGAQAPADLDALMTKAYAWRSDMLHGRGAMVDSALNLRIRVLVAALAEAAAERLLAKGTITEDEDE